MFIVKFVEMVFTCHHCTAAQSIPSLPEKSQPKLPQPRLPVTACPVEQKKKTKKETQTQRRL